LFKPVIVDVEEQEALGAEDVALIHQRRPGPTGPSGPTAPSGPPETDRTAR